MGKKIRVCKDFTYSSIIKEAILLSKDGKATSSQIFTYITNKHPDLFKQSNSMTWKGNIRQLLSKNPEFVKLKKDEKSKLHYWKYVPIEEIIENEKAESYKYKNIRPEWKNNMDKYSNSEYRYISNMYDYPSIYDPNYNKYTQGVIGYDTNYFTNPNMESDIYRKGDYFRYEKSFINNQPEYKPAGNPAYLEYKYNNVEGIPASYQKVLRTHNIGKDIDNYTNDLAYNDNLKATSVNNRNGNLPEKKSKEDILSYLDTELEETHPKINSKSYTGKENSKDNISA